MKMQKHQIIETIHWDSDFHGPNKYCEVSDGHFSNKINVNPKWNESRGKEVSVIVPINFKLIEIVILWVYYTIPFGLSLFRHFLVIACQLFIPYVRLRITDEGSVPEMRIWSILLIQSN